MAGLQDPALERVYAASRGPVAFIDESHRAGVRPGEIGFYTTAAVIVARDQLDAVRTAIESHAGGRPWHTTEEFQAGRHHDILRLADYLTSTVEWNIVAAQAPMAGHTAIDYAQARNAALTATLTAVTRGANPVQVVVLDTLGDPRADGADQRLAALLRGTAAIPPRTLLRHSDDKLEPLLGAPDVVAWATRRLLAVDDRQWFDHIADVTTLLDARTNTPVNLPQLLAQLQPTTPAQRATAAIAASFPPVTGVSTGKALAALLAQSATAQARQRAAGNTRRDQGPQSAR